MSYSVDANVLIYASDVSSPRHSTAREFLSTCAARSELFCVAWPTLMAYLRISTPSSIVPPPPRPTAADGNVEALRALPHGRVVSEQPGFWETYREVASSGPVRGNLVPDAHLAAILRQNEVGTLFTNDADFRRFDFLQLRNPFG